MVYFKKNNEALYLVTNYKVMFSSIAKQQNLEQFVSKQLALKIVLNAMHLNKMQFHLIVRNPYDRLESFFKDKFRQCIKTCEQKGEWQYCQKIFFPHLGLDTSMANTVIANKLLGVSFKEFISYLGDTYKNDGHLYPQHWALGMRIAKFPNFYLPIKFQKIYKMEANSDLESLMARFDINLKTIANSTKKIATPIEWGEDELAMVQKIYKKDFEVFGYAIKK